MESFIYNSDFLYKKGIWWIYTFIIKTGQYILHCGFDVNRKLNPNRTSWFILLSNYYSKVIER